MMPDSSQEAATDFFGSRALVLAGPGCGKTRILAERVARAREKHGVRYGDMLCLTFTNRAARGMRDRIAARLGEVPEGLYVGNIHRFCIGFLYDNGLISAGTTIIDEDEAAEFIDRSGRSCGATWVSEVMATAVDMYMQEHEYPRQLRRRLWFEPQEHHCRCAREYERYKRDNGLMDFDDCLLWTYDALRDGDGADLCRSRYSWVQVDEVQDLSPLQMAIVHQLTPAHDATVLYLGDEQQAIFEFIGAGSEVLARVRDECSGRVLRLRRNYRSAAGLVELCNAFAVSSLGINPVFLPDALPECGGEENAATLWRASENMHKYAVVALARRLGDEHPGESTAILVRTNAELAEVHRLLEDAGLAHIAVGMRDVFRLVAFKTLFAHMAVVVDPMRTAEWARLLYQTGCVRRLDDATKIVTQMRDAAMTPADLLGADGLSAVGRAVKRADAGEQLNPVTLNALGRLLFPQRRRAAAGGLMELFEADGASAAAELQAYLMPTLRTKCEEQKRLSATLGLDALRARMLARYAPLYNHTREMMECDEISRENTLGSELSYVYRQLVLSGYVDRIPRWESVLALLCTVVADASAEPRLREQLGRHLHELCSFNDGDIYDKGLSERLSVMTVHKAKGLEMDNVIVYNANSFRGSHLDRARVFYVAFSRARKRLSVFYSRFLTDALEGVKGRFCRVPDNITDSMAAEEYRRSRKA